MKKLIPFLMACALPHLSWGQLVEFRATLDGAQETPPHATPAVGWANASLDLGAHWFTLEYFSDDLLGPQTAAHIHLGALGVAGPVLYPLPLPVLPGFSATASFAITDADIANLFAGDWYVNVHSAIYPAGEIRGQLVPVPEPATYAVGAATLLGFLIVARRRIVPAGMAG